MNDHPSVRLQRGVTQRRPLIDGRPAHDGTVGRARRRVQRLLTSAREREESALEHRIRTLPGVTRPNTLVLLSPNGGVGKTTLTFAVGNLLVSHLRLRVVAVDVNCGFGTLARLAPDETRSGRGLDDVLRDADRLHTAAQLRPYMSQVPTGLHLLGAPRDPHAMASVGPDRYGELVAFLSCFYDVVLLDLGTGMVARVARLALSRADQVMLVTTAEWATASVAVVALSHLERHDRTTVAINQATLHSRDAERLEERFRSAGVHRTVTIPHDPQLAATLDCGTYALGALTWRTRMALKRLGMAVAEQLQ